MRFSLIVATRGRVAELRQLFESFAQQTCRDFEVIVVDQNPDDRLDWTEAPGTFAFPVIRKRSSVNHSSHARNLGLMAAAGEIVAFPDDDCLYPPGLLAQVDAAFRDQPDLGVRTGPAAAPEGGLSNGRWQPFSSPIGVANVWNTAIEFNIFLRRELALRIGGFDEQLGVGGKFGSAEGNDLVLRAVQSGWRGWYDIAQLAVHPERPIEVTARRAFTYGAGLGYAMRKHHVPARVWLNLMIRPLGGCLVYFARGNPTRATYHWRTLRGRMHGFSAWRGAG